ncbi:MAG: hypothetical protein MJZ88_05870 [Paludibacteraceae bacterium]|nr:hypothetical protein [Paludibacteraceae bacterium]
MKHILSIFISVAMGALLCSCGVQKSQASYDFSSKVLSSNEDGSYVIRTQVRARNAVIAFTDAQRKVVKEVIFDGVQAGSNGIEALKPLCFDKNARAKHEDYFNAFFADEGAWKQYASLKDKRLTTTTYARNGKQMVETVTVTVNRAELKRKLQEDGIIPAQNMYQL